MSESHYCLIKLNFTTITGKQSRAAAKTQHRREKSLQWSWICRLGSRYLVSSHAVRRENQQTKLGARSASRRRCQSTVTVITTPASPWILLISREIRFLTSYLVRTIFTLGAISKRKKFASGSTFNYYISLLYEVNFYFLLFSSFWRSVVAPPDWRKPRDLKVRHSAGDAWWCES